MVKDWREGIGLGARLGLIAPERAAKAAAVVGQAPPAEFTPAALAAEAGITIDVLEDLSRLAESLSRAASCGITTLAADLLATPAARATTDFPTQRLDPIPADVAALPTVPLTTGETTPPEAASGPPRRIGPYTLLKPLGRGAMGAVYLAREAPLGRLVALKVMLPGYAEDSGARERFQREARAGAALSHPHVVSLLAFGEEEGTLYCAMEYVEGRTLAEVLRRERVTQERAAALLMQAARGLAHAHEKGTVHRDVKPGNLLVTWKAVEHAGELSTREYAAVNEADTSWREGAEGPEGAPSRPTVVGLRADHVKVADFGLARLEGATTLTVSRAGMGTPAYMAPEQFESGRAATAASDVYSLGATLYEALTGRPPFHADGIEALRKRIEEEEPLPPRKLAPGVDIDLQTVCLKCLEKDPRRRYGDAGQLATDLARWLRGEAVLARPVGFVGRTVRRVRRRPLVSAMLAALILAGIAIPGMVGVQRARDAGRLADALREGRVREASSDWQSALAAYEAALRLSPGHPEASAGRERSARQVEATELALSRKVKEEREKAERARRETQAEKTRAKKRGASETEASKRTEALLAAGKEVALAERDAREGRMMSALAHAIAAIRFDPTKEAENMAWSLHKGVPRILWTSPAGPPGHTGVVTSVAFWTGGKHVVSGSYDGTVRFWEASTGKVLKDVLSHAAAVWSFAMSSDRRRIATGDQAGTIRIWDLTTGRESLSLEGHEGAVLSLSFNREGTVVASGASDKTVRLWDVSGFVTNQREMARLAGHAGPVESVAFFPDGTRLASGSWDGSIRLWSVSSHEELARWEGHAGRVRAIAFTPDGARLVSGSSDMTVRVWNVAQGGQEAAFRGHTDVVSCVAVSLDGRRVASGSWDKSVRIWDIARGVQIAQLEGHRWPVRAVAFMPEGTRVLSGSEDGTVRLWSISPEILTEQTDYEANLVTSLAQSADGRLVATGRRDHTVRVYTGITGSEVARIEGHLDVVTCVALSSDGQRVASGSDDGTERVWEVSSGREVARGPSPASGGAVRSIAFSSDGSKILSGYADGTVHLWDSATRSEVGAFKGMEAAVDVVAFSSDGREIWTAYDDGTVRVWSPSQSRPVVHRVRAKHSSDESPVTVLSTSPDGRLLAVARGKSGVQLWNLSPWMQVARLEGHREAVISVAFSPNGYQVATQGRSGEVKLWDLAAGGRALGVADDKARLIHGEWRARHRLPASANIPPVERAEPEDEKHWTEACGSAVDSKTRLPCLLIPILAAWDRDVGMRAQIEVTHGWNRVGGDYREVITGQKHWVEQIPTPGLAYSRDSEIAKGCR